MALSLVAAPAIEPIYLEEAKAQCRIDHGDEDALVQALIRASRDYVENFTHRALITQTWDWQIDGFPCGDLVLPLAPVSSVTSVTYLDSAGTSQTWSSSNYRTDLPAGPKAPRARLAPGYGVLYPTTYDVINAVTVRFVAGYGATTATVPFAIKQALLLLIAHWYKTREPVVTGTIVSPVQHSVDGLLWPYKAF